MFGFIFWLITLYLNDQICFKKEDKLSALDRSSMLTLCSEGSHGHSLEADGQGDFHTYIKPLQTEEVGRLGVARASILRVSLGCTSG